MKVYIVHKKELNNRLATILYYLMKCDFIDCVEIVTAETSDLNFTTIQEKAKFIPQDFPMKDCSVKEKSVYHKHYEVMKKISKETSPCMVLEDDLYFDPKELDRLVKETKEIAFDYDFIFFGTGCNLSIYGTGFVENKNRFKSKCADSFIVTPDAAFSFVEDVKKEGAHLPVDWDMNYRFLKLETKVFWYEPGVVFQGSQTGVYKSEIQ